MAPPEQVRGRSLPELREMLRRQERLLADRKFISRLADKGKKICDLAERLKIAILQEEELRRTSELLAAVRLEFQKKQGETQAREQKTAASRDNLTPEDSSVSEHHVLNKEFRSALQNDQSAWARKRSAEIKIEPGGRALLDSDAPEGNEGVSEGAAVGLLQSDRMPPEHNSLGNTGNAARPAGGSHEEAFGSTLTESRTCEGGLGKGQTLQGHPLQSLPSRPPQTPHYAKVLELRAKSPAVRKSKFKTHILPAESSGSSRSSPGGSSPEGPSAEERLRRDRKHLDDITAARLPPLHHAPTQLLSMAESIAIQIQQKETYEEMQAKLAAQKLAQRLDVPMTRYEPEGGLAASYREVRDEEDSSSAED